ncbi:MAG: hypothetical protein U0Z44_21865 [Kouleothrix sp.]
MARTTLAHVNIPFGLALLEDGQGQGGSRPPAAQIWEREPALLQLASRPDAAAARPTDRRADHRRARQGTLAVSAPTPT